jgi:hypothetical protein
MAPAPKLLSRDEFRVAVFARDGHKCVLCGKTADETPEGKHDAHHLYERKLWTSPGEEGGYFLDNGVTVCEADHMRCEQTLVSVEEAREAARITRAVLPSHLYVDEKYDKWGNAILANGTRLRGELFFDESVQKVLAEVLHLFTPYVKYPRSHHLPWSPGVTDDDRVQNDLSGLEGEEIVVTLKLDGENTNMYADYIHARSLEYAPRIDRDRVKALHGQIAHELPEGWRVAGENLWGEHSIRYENLPAVFFVFSIWNEKNEALSWDDTVAYANMLGLHTVPVLYRGPYDRVLLERMIPERLHASALWSTEAEGYVVRTTAGFRFSEFRKKLLKWVRAGHVQTQAHWTRHIKPNGFVEGLR